jgi:excisionase family DNA binding protein
MIDVAIKAVELYANSHPRPPHVNQVQAAQMLGLSVPTVRKLIKAGTLRLNKCGLIPIAEIDKAISV